MVIDDRLGWRHAANARKTFVNDFGEEVLVVLNAHGHRGPLRDRQARRGVFRVLALGDSFTEGTQVGEKELFSARMELADPRLEVLNAGVGGYSTVQEYLYLASVGLQFQPNLVLLIFFENDLSDNAITYYPGFGPRPYARLAEDGSIHIVEALDSSPYERFILPAPFRMTLNTHSYFYYFVNSRIYQPLFAKRMRELQQADLRNVPTDTGFQIFKRMLEKIHGWLNQRHIPLLLVVIPNREEATTGSSVTAANISGFCRARGINCLSLLDRFHRETSAGAQLYFPVDMHWTKEGHRVAADEILKYLRSRPELHSGALHF